MAHRLQTSASRTGPTFGFPVLLAALLLLSGCASRPMTGGPQTQQTVIARPGAPSSPELALAPAFVLSHTDEAHNRIGRVVAAGVQGNERIDIDSEHQAIYVASQRFTTDRAAYTNLIFRIHFSKQPYSLIPFHLGAGKHVGLLVILTLDEPGQVLLVTTANTCGCYAVTIPTATLAAEFYPDDWPDAPLPFYGERLPSRLPAIGPEDRLVALIRPEVQRIMDLQVQTRTAPLPKPVIEAETPTLASLRQLELADGSRTSFYYDRGPLKGHVKGAIKPWETLLLSLVSLDLFVGMDKDYGDTRESGNPFYTSLKPWNRTASDLNDFAAYLRFNGWKL